MWITDSWLLHLKNCPHVSRNYYTGHAKSVQEYNIDSSDDIVDINNGMQDKGIPRAKSELLMEIFNRIGKPFSVKC